MNKTPTFETHLRTCGRWSVLIATGHGPDSHVGDFETEEEAKNWIETKSKDWPGKSGAQINPR
jgi:hypothetical protein